MRLDLSRRTVRLRFTALYGVVFLLSGTGLLAIVVLVTSGLSSVGRSQTVSAPAEGPQGPPTALPDAQAHIRRLQDQLAQQQTTEMHRLLVGSLIALGVMAVVSVVLGRLVAGRVLRPLRTITAATRRITADNLHARLAVPGPVDEVKDLADTIDELLERLEGAFAAERRFVANASHELRTPLATMRASLDVAVGKPEPLPLQTLTLANRLRTELDQVDRLLEGLLALARTRHAALPDRARLPLERLVAAALADRADTVAAKGLTLHGAVDRPVTWVRGSRTLLGRMVDNVIDNAVRHNHAEGWIRVSTELDATTARLVVETGGQVLDHRQVEQLGRPFRRLGADRTGSESGAGLGLSIVAAIAEAHGGILALRARPEGGLWVEISLPRADLADGPPVPAAAVTAGPEVSA